MLLVASASLLVTRALYTTSKKELLVAVAMPLLLVALRFCHLFVAKKGHPKGHAIHVGP